jgi:quinol monooxygenase YgiN
MSAETEGRIGGVQLSGRLICTSQAEAEIVREHLPEHIRLTRSEPGCMSFDVIRTDDPLVWRVEESFRDKPAFEFHQQRTRSSAWWEATAEIARDFRVTGLD